MESMIWNDELVDQLEFAWNVQFFPRLKGLSDEEYLWEPVSDCWSIRPDASGVWALDHIVPEPVPAPFTTIAWRIMHLADVFGRRTSRHFGDWSFDLAKHSLPATANDGLAWLSELHETWVEHVRSLGEVGLSRPCGQSEPLYPDAPIASLILHVNREFLHHAAEIQLLRDLYLRLGNPQIID